LPHELRDEASEHSNRVHPMVSAKHLSFGDRPLAFSDREGYCRPGAVECVDELVLP
jgi:hypothetical protein